MDNVRTHKIAGVREAIEAAGAELRYLPAYSPDLNTIENAYAKIKSDLRKGAARTVHALWKLVGRGVKRLRPPMRRLLQTRRLSRLIRIRWNPL
jgi:transposase